jgi:hypothetical protein
VKCTWHIFVDYVLYLCLRASHSESITVYGLTDWVVSSSLTLTSQWPRAYCNFSVWILLIHVGLLLHIYFLAITSCVLSLLLRITLDAQFYGSV